MFTSTVYRALLILMDCTHSGEGERNAPDDTRASDAIDTRDTVFIIVCF